MIRILVVAITVGVLSTACGGSATSLSQKALENAIESESGQSVDIESTADGFTVKTADGSISIGGANDDQVISGTDADGNDFKLTDGTHVPDGFPLPVPDNVDVTHGSTTETGGMVGYSVTLSFDPSVVDEIVAFYETALIEAHLNLVGSSKSPDSVSMVADSDTVSVVIDMQNYGDYWEANIFWSPM